MQDKNFYISPNFHYDVAYLKSYDEYLPICFEIIHSALDIIQENDDYKFLIEQVILLEEYWNAFPEKRELLKRFVKEGNITIAPGMYVMPDMNMIDGESFFIQAKYGFNWLKENLDFTPRVCWIADCWGHQSQLPQILSQTGYEYYVMYRCMRRDVMRNDFWWESPDGTKIKTHWLSSNYCGMQFKDARSIENKADQRPFGSSIEDFNKMFDEMQKYGKSDSVLICNGGDMRFPQKYGLEVLESIDSSEKFTNIKFATPEDYLDTVDWDKMPVFDGEFVSSMQGTLTTNIKIKQYNRDSVRKLASLEALSVITSAKDVNYDEVWKLVLKQQFHDIICGSICDKALTECYDESQNALALIDYAFKSLESDIGENVVFNSLAFDRTLYIENANERMKADVKAFGFTALQDCVKLKETEKPTLPCKFENDYYSAEIDEKGFITSLKTKPGNVEIASNSPCAFGSLIMQVDYGDSWLNFEGPISGGTMESALTQNNRDPYTRSEPNGIINNPTWPNIVSSARVVCANEEELIIEQESMTIFWRLRERLITQIKFSKNLSRIEYTTKLFPIIKDYRIRAAFPTSVKNGKILHEVAYGIQERGEAEHSAQNWIDYSDKNYGLSLLNKGNPGNNVDNGILLLTLFRSAAMEYKSQSDLSYAEGVEHTFEYAIYPHESVKAEDLIKQGLDFTREPELVNIDLANAQYCGWSISESNVFVSALRWSGDYIFLRIYEGTGKSGEVKIGIPSNLSVYAIADGIEKPLEDFKSCSEYINVELKPFEIKGFLFKSK